ncbi:actin organization and endocytosis protein [Xylographa opegraphella]|nr:actin organization and endocytosis protein [Xylographa opegraphella]
MYSKSPSYLGGAQSFRPGATSYGQASFSRAPQGQQLPNRIAQQPAAYGGNSLQPHSTSFPGQNETQNLQTPSQQPAYTGYPTQNQQSYQSQAPLLQEPLKTSQLSQQSLLPQRTGQTSSQIAQSFQSGSSQLPPMTASSSGVKIPKIRLSFLTAQDQAKFEQLFKSAVGDGQALDGDKVRDLLIRSKLQGSDLMHIWVLSDTTKSGQLLFPEFALAMYLCNLKLVGKELPRTLPERITNEVSSMVDIISFGVPDDRHHVESMSNGPNFDSLSRSTASPGIQQPQPQTSNSQLLAQLTSQPTGFASQYIPPQLTGILQPQPTGLPLQQANFQRFQQTDYQPNATATTYSGPQPPMPPIPTGFSSQYSLLQLGTAPLPLNVKPTGSPGQWGLVNAPASGLPNIDALQQRMMPQPGREGGYTTAGLSGTATVPWAVTKDEKKIYDHLFRAWDGFNKGYIGGDVAIEVMGQSGLEKSDLEKIWTLSDPNNKGRLDMDEFAVAMHLIYRKLNGYPVPNRLPPELVPPSTRNFADSIGTVKSLLSQDAEARINTGAFLQPQRTGVSYLKTHSFRTDSKGVTPLRKDATVYRNNDDDIGYKSSARRRLGGGGRTPSPIPLSSPSSDSSNDKLTMEQLRKVIREKQILLNAIDFNDDDAADEEDALVGKDRREVEELYQRIRHVQEDIDHQPAAAIRKYDSGAERRTLKRQLQSLIDRLPELASTVRRIERSIADRKLELFRQIDAKAHPGSASAVVGTGPGGAVTEVDRLKARAKAMMQQRSAALTGIPMSANTDDTSAATSRLAVENSRIRTEKDNNERMIKDVEDSVRDFSKGLEDSLREDDESTASEHEKRRWEDGLGVEDDVKDFIFDLQRSSRAARARTEEYVLYPHIEYVLAHRNSTKRERQEEDLPGFHSRHNSIRDHTSTKYDQTIAYSEKVARPLTPVNTYSAYKTAEERAAFIKQQAEQRMAERLAALGLKPPPRTAETGSEKQEREARQREERLRQAAMDDFQRNQERERRLNDEQPSSPNGPKVSTKRPPPPPSRKSRTGSVGQQAEAKRKNENEVEIQRPQQDSREDAIRKQKSVQEEQARALEDGARHQKEVLAKEREASEARLKVLEEQVRTGKVKKQDEKRRKQAAEKEAKEQEAKLGAQRAELEAARERERQLQLQLESLSDDNSSGDGGNAEVTPEENTPTNSQFLTRDVIPAYVAQNTSRKSSSASAKEEVAVNSLPAAPVPLNTQAAAYNDKTKNPFFRKLSQSGDSNLAPLSQLPSSNTPTSTNEISTNPFHRLAQQESAAKALLPQYSTVTGNRPSRVRPEEDEWSVVDSTEGSSDDDNEQPTGGSAKQLASMLFGTMAPSTRPLSAMDESKSPTTPKFGRTPTASMSPLTPSMPDMNAPPAPPPPPPMPNPTFLAPGPPPPPPMPGSPAGAASGPPSPGPIAGGGKSGPSAVGALLGEIIRGKGLKKVETKDRSQSNIAGRVLN